MNKKDILYKQKNTRLYNYHNLDRLYLEVIVRQIYWNRRKLNLPVTRTFTSYKREIVAHQRLYKLHLFRKHTIDCDLEENIKKWKDIIYYIIGV